MTEIEFKALGAQGFNRIPLLEECLADLDTPVSLYLKLVAPERRANTFLLESVVGGERFGRYSFIGLPSRTQLRCSGSTCQVITDGVVIETHEGDPLEFLEQFKARYKAALRVGLPRFCGGLAGYFGYDLVRFIEPKLGPSNKPDLLNTPDLLMMVVDELVIVDNLAGRLYFMVYADPRVAESYQRAQLRLRELRARLKLPANEPAPITPQDAALQGPVIRRFAQADYLEAARKAREYIIAGDLMQVQIGQCIQRPYHAHPFTLYRALRNLNPSPYMYYYDFGDFHVVGASPEILVRAETV